MRHPLPEGTRVHHKGCLWSYGFTEEECAEHPSWGWATVLQCVPQPDRTYEYEIEKDAPVCEGMSTRYWWASYHIDDARPGSVEVPS